ncbi:MULTISPECIES: T9SS sorting signal type C domain-containing protein [Winogradskyella]|uniref:T9SS sorting signal type C domain-containing protein n=1 Tax=Winogradskyella TaxID=286104 RepID=UPI0015CA59F2|nr:MULTISPECIES: T9SS sorting signal type C domain-containing protein [Winogradskyella]QXP80634.1 T9SS sorting signal type C domain-containing protein [Winogradskyella sp. HaHa_3_26]
MNTILHFLSSKKNITAFLLLFSAVSFYAQAVVTNIFPTRVTTGSKVTIIGTGFTDGDQSGISITNMSTGSKTFVSSTEMTFKITATTTTDRTGTLSITGVSGASTTFNYIAPTTTNKTVSASSEIRVREVYTTWDQNGDGEHFWKSSDWDPDNDAAGKATWPNDSHELLGFKMNYGGNDIIFSTGVDNAFLETKLSALGVDVSATSTEYVSQEFKAYSTNGVSGKPNSNNYMGFADKIDGFTDSNVLNNAVRKTVYDVIIDGDHGLDLGTGIANFNNQADIRFYSGNGDVGAVNDGIPDLLITQMAQPGGSDVYYYADVDGNVVGRPVKLSFVNHYEYTDPNSSETRLYQWRVDFYRLDYSASATFETAIPTVASFGNKGDRGFRMAALSLEDFEIDGSPTAAAYENINSIDNINMGAGGSSDMSFMAYNKSTFDIKSPVIDKSPVSRFVCRFPSSEFVFTALGSIEGTENNSDPKEEITYTWFENNTLLSETSNTFTIPAGLYSSDLEDTSYRVRVANGYGAVDLPFTITEGGTPAYWNGTNWVLASVYTDNSISVPDGDRSLIVTADYNDPANVEGCDCTVPAGKNVTIPEGYAMTLYNSLTVEEEVAATTVDGVAVDAIPAATFTIEDDASLVQINDVENSGDIKVIRKAEGLHQYDYVYWSSPVETGLVSNLPGDRKYSWETDVENANGTRGNWVNASGSMSIGKGYIARVNTVSDDTALFTGKPSNGNISWPVDVSGTGGQGEGNSNWNLIGNPYPSSINAYDFLTVNSVDNAVIDGGVHLWTHDYEIATTVNQYYYEDFGMNYGNQYITYNYTGSSDASASDVLKIASGQGFFVKILNSATSASVTFTNDMRHDDEEAYDNSGFYRNSEETLVSTEKQLVWLSLANENNHAISTLIGYVDGATEEKDRLYDSNTNNGGFNLYSLITEEDKLVIQGLPLPFVDTNTVPLGIELSQSGIYNIAIAKLKGSLFEEQEQDIYLEDTYTNVVHDLRTVPYTFTGDQGTFNDRFILRYTEPVTLSVEEISNTNTFAYINDAMFYVKSSSIIESVDIYDISGKQITNYTSNENSNTFSTEFNFAKGVYIASIKLDNGSIVTKKLIN